LFYTHQNKEKVNVEPRIKLNHNIAKTISRNKAIFLVVISLFL